jgi:hypothetical protein
MVAGKPMGCEAPEPFFGACKESKVDGNRQEEIGQTGFHVLGNPVLGFKKQWPDVLVAIYINHFINYISMF